MGEEQERSCPSTLTERLFAPISPLTSPGSTSGHRQPPLPTPCKVKIPQAPQLCLESARRSCQALFIIPEMDFLSSSTVSFFQADQAIYGCLRSRVLSVTQNGRHSGVLALVAGGRGSSAHSQGFPNSPPPRGDPRHNLHSLSLQAPRCLPTKAPASDPRCPWRVWKQETFYGK